MGSSRVGNASAMRDDRDHGGGPAADHFEAANVDPQTCRHEPDITLIPAAGLSCRVTVRFSPWGPSRVGVSGAGWLAAPPIVQFGIS